MRGQDLKAFLGPGKGRISPKETLLANSFPQMLYQNDLHPTPTLHLTSKNRIEITVPEDIGHALVQIRTTGPGGDGVPAEVHIVRNGGAVYPVSPRRSRVHPEAEIIPAQTRPQPGQSPGRQKAASGTTFRVALTRPCHLPSPQTSLRAECAPCLGMKVLQNPAEKG